MWCLLCMLPAGKNKILDVHPEEGKNPSLDREDVINHAEAHNRCYRLQGRYFVVHLSEMADFGLEKSHLANQARMILEQEQP